MKIFQNFKNLKSETPLIPSILNKKLFRIVKKKKK